MVVGISTPLDNLESFGNRSDLEWPAESLQAIRAIKDRNSAPSAKQVRSYDQ